MNCPLTDWTPEFIPVYFYLASPGLYIPHARSVGMESDHSSKVHVFIEEL